MALPTADAEPTPRWRPALAWSRLVETFEKYPLERIGLAALAAGIVLRLAAPFFMDIRSDGNTYAAMGHAWAMRHEFLMPYGDVTTWAPTPAGYSNHYPPAYPLYLGIVFKLFGFGLWQVKWAAVAMAIAALVVVYYTTRDLYGRAIGALSAGLMGLEPHLLWSTGAGFSENMVLAFFALTMWAIVKSLKDDRYIVLAGLFAALAYLSRASVGYFFVVAGMGGLLWRLLHRGWSVLTNVWYLAAIALFVGIAGAWAVRNVLLFGHVPRTFTNGDVLAGVAGALLVGGLAVTLPFLANAKLRRLANLAPGLVALAAGAIAGAVYLGFRLLDPALLAGSLVVEVPLWETSSYTRYVQELALTERPWEWRQALVAKIPFFLAFLAWYVIPLLPESWKATTKIRQEDTSALWLSVFLVWIIAWAFTSMFWVFEKSSMYWLDNHRYVVIGLLPLGWLLLREARTDRASFRVRYALLLVSLFVACAATIVSPVKFSDLRAAEHMDPYLQAGDEIAVDGASIKYAFYAYLSQPEEMRIYGWTAGESPEFVLTSSKNDGDYGTEYVKVAEYRQPYWHGGVMPSVLYAREDVVTARGIETGILVEATL